MVPQSLSSRWCSLPYRAACREGAGGSQVLRIPVLPGWVTCPQVQSKAPVSTWAAKQGQRALLLTQKQRLHYGGPLGDPHFTLLPFTHASGCPWEHTCSVLLSIQPFSLFPKLRSNNSWHPWAFIMFLYTAEYV